MVALFGQRVCASELQSFTHVQDFVGETRRENLFCSDDQHWEISVLLTCALTAGGWRKFKTAYALMKHPAG